MRRPDSIGPRDRLSLACRSFLGRLAAPLLLPCVWAALRYLRGYRLQDVRAAREAFRRATARGGPLLICPNHLTLVDSALIAWALAPPWRYALCFRLLPWNTPERRNFDHPLARILCWFLKCLPIERGGSRAKQQQVLRRCGALLARGEPVLIFPEGGRSRTGRIDRSRIAHGAGRLIRSVPNCQVLCVYLRGVRQETWSDLPAGGEQFRVRVRLIRPHSSFPGVRGTREVTEQVIRTLEELEADHFRETGVATAAPPQRRERVERHPNRRRIDRRNDSEGPPRHEAHECPSRTGPL